MNENSAPPPQLTNRLRYFMATGCAILVGNIYYCQPLLGAFGRAFHVNDKSAALINILTQAGYLLGLFFIVPMGDMIERKRLIVWMHGCAGLALLGAAAAPGIAWMGVASLLVGISTTACQVFIPFAAQLAKDEERGKVVGTMMGGLLTGILVSRTFSGIVAQTWGWRSVYYFSAGMMAVMVVLLSIFLPNERPAFKGTYRELMRSLWHLIRTQPVVRQSSMIGAALFGALSAFWATLAFFLQGPPYGYVLSVIGLFGLIGAGGAMVSPLIGRLIDRRSPLIPIRVGIGLMLLGFLLLFQATSSVWVVVGGVVLLDVGMQCAHIPNLARNYALLPEARTRLNTIYMSAYFVGGTLGSTLGSIAWNAAGWGGVCGTGLGLTAVGGAVLLAATFRDRRVRSVA